MWISLGSVHVFGNLVTVKCQTYISFSQRKAFNCNINEMSKTLKIYLSITGHARKKVVIVLIFSLKIIENIVYNHIYMHLCQWLPLL